MEMIFLLLSNTDYIFSSVKAFYNNSVFQLTNPEWKPPDNCSMFLTDIKEQGKEMHHYLDMNFTFLMIIKVFTKCGHVQSERFASNHMYLIYFDTNCLKET